MLRSYLQLQAPDPGSTGIGLAVLQLARMWIGFENSSMAILVVR